MIDTQDAIRVHEILIDKFGGSKGIRKNETFDLFIDSFNDKL